MRFAGFAIANAVAHAVVLDSYQNCISQDEVEKRVLQRCLSGELAGVSEIPPMSEAEEIALEDKVAQLVFIENPRAGPFSVYRRIAGCVDASILDTFRQIQNVIDDSQDADSSTYCLHDLYNRRIDFLAMEKATYRLLAPQSDPIVSPRLDREIRCAVAAGRANGVDLRVMLNAAVVWKAQGDRTLRQAAIRALSGTVLTRYNPLFTSFAFLSTHIQSHNNTPLFLADMYRSLVSELPPFKPVSLPPSLPLLTTALLPFPDLKRPHLFSSASTICTPRCCPPDICSSGKRPPIKENYELAEELFMSLFSIRCDALALRAIAPTAEARAMMAVELVRQSGLMDVGKDHQRRALVIVLPSIYAESQIKLCRLAAGKNELLPEVVGCLYKTLVSEFVLDLNPKLIPLRTVCSNRREVCVLLRSDQLVRATAGSHQASRTRLQDSMRGIGGLRQQHRLRSEYHSGVVQGILPRSRSWIPGSMGIQGRKLPRLHRSSHQRPHPMSAHPARRICSLARSRAPEGRGRYPRGDLGDFGKRVPAAASRGIYHSTGSSRFDEASRGM